jgi:copper chaperone CopZ
MKNVLVLCGMLFIGFAMNAQEKETKWKTIDIQTSVTCSDGCGDYEDIIEDALNYVKGVKYAEINRETKIVTVKYNSAKINVQDLRKAISEVGYDADGVKANPEATLKLPACCQPGNKEHN